MRLSYVLLLVSLPVFASSSGVPQGALPTGSSLVELRSESAGDFVGDDRVVGEPATGKIWIVDPAGNVRSFQKSKPWKSRSKKRTLTQILEQAPAPEPLAPVKQGVRR